MKDKEVKQNFLNKVLRKFGYEPLRDTSQVTPELAEEQEYAGVPSDTNDWLKTYTESVWSYVCVNKIGTSCAKIPFKFYKKRITKKGQRQELTEGELSELFIRVNPWMTKFGLWNSTIAFALLTGNSYWELVTDGKSKKTKEIYLLRPDRMKIKPDPKTFIQGYIYNINGKDVPFMPDDILHFKTFSPLSDYYGTPPTQPASLLIALDLYSLKYNSNFFKAGARIYGVLETERSLSDRAVKRLERKWIGKYGGYQKAFRTAVLEEGLKYKPISSTHKDMDFIAQMKIVRESICSSFGVYPAVVGLFEYCITGDSKVLLSSGETIPIKDLKIGQEVLNYNIDAKDFENHKIKNIMPRGKRTIYELRTGNRIIKATDNHPFLTLTRGINPTYPRKIKWKKLKDLKKYDIVAILTEIPDKDRDNLLPDGTKATKDLMEQLGVYIGDGSCYFQYSAIKEEKERGLRGGGISIALPENDPNREYYIRQAIRVWKTKRIFKDERAIHITQRKTCFLINSTKAVEEIYKWCLNGTARKKRIPSWIFKLNKDLKKAFLKGYFDADGSYMKFKRQNPIPRIAVGASNENFIEQIRELCIEVGYSVCNISETHRQNNYGWNDLWRFLICSVDKKVGCVTSGKSLRKLPKGLDWATIRSIKELSEKEETYDIEIADTHNFFANGILVANSNYSNSSEQRQFFYEETIIPHLTWLQEYVTAFLCPKFGPRIIGEFDQSAIGALKEKEEIKARKSGILRKYDILSKDEIRNKFYDMGKYEGKESEGTEKLNSAGKKRILEIVSKINGNLNAREELSNIIRAIDDGGDG